MGNSCNVCPLSKWEFVSTNCFNVDCKNAGRRIASNVKTGDMIPTPLWCSKLSTTPIQRYDMWTKLTPNVAWDDIKIGDKFHIPPHNNQTREDIEVVSINSYCFSYKTNKYSYTQTMYPSYLAYKVMVRPKNYVPTL